MNFSEPVMQQRANKIAGKLAPHIETRDHVLDIGAGGCRVSAKLKDLTEAAITPLDTVDHNRTSMDLQLYDGITIPYPDDSFSVASLVFVLHHAENPTKLLSEAARVSRRRVLVVEDSPRNQLERHAWRMFDDRVNHGVHEDIALAHDTKTTEEWEVDFTEAGLYLQAAHTFRSFYTTGLRVPSRQLHFRVCS